MASAYACDSSHEQNARSESELDAYTLASFPPTQPGNEASYILEYICIHYCIENIDVDEFQIVTTLQ